MLSTATGGGTGGKVFANVRNFLGGAVAVGGHWYRGTATEFDTTASAVAQTSGQVLLSSSGQILLAEYAATQALTGSAHGGIGMSQWGAASLAQQG